MYIAAKADIANELCEREPFMAKPYDLEQLVKRIRTLIDLGNKKSP